MKTFPFEVVNLTDFYLTREEHRRAMRRAYREIDKARSMAFMAFLATGLLIGVVMDQKKRIDALEARLDEQEETAG